MFKETSGSQKGFTLIEVMIVIAIMGILAAIAIPNFISYRKRSYDAAAQSDLTAAYSMTLGYFAQDKHANVTAFTLTDIKNEGFRQSAGVVVVVSGVDSSEFVISAKHERGDVTYSMDEEGNRTRG